MFSKDMFRQYRQFEPGEFIICAVDTAGEGQDWNAGQFLSKNRLDVPLVLHYEGSITDVTPELKLALELIQMQTGVNPVVAYETNNGGGYEFERLSRLNKLQKYTMYRQYKQDERGKLKHTDKLGWSTNSATRGPMLIELQDMVKNNLVRLYDKLTIDEMFSFVKHKTQLGSCIRPRTHRSSLFVVHPSELERGSMSKIYKCPQCKARLKSQRGLLWHVQEEHRYE
jgi:hypothetical protein